MALLRCGVSSRFCGFIWYVISERILRLYNTYQVLFLDFSGIDTDGGHDAIYQRVNEKLDNYLQVFLKRYAYAENLIC